MICSAINQHLAIKKLYISTLEFDFSTYQYRDLHPEEIVQSKNNHKNPAPLREYKVLNAKKYPFKIIVKDLESYKVNQNTKCSLN